MNPRRIPSLLTSEYLDSLISLQSNMDVWSPNTSGWFIDGFLKHHASTGVQLFDKAAVMVLFTRNTAVSQALNQTCRGTPDWIIIALEFWAIVWFPCSITPFYPGVCDAVTWSGIPESMHKSDILELIDLPPLSNVNRPRKHPVCLLALAMYIWNVEITSYPVFDFKGYIWGKNEKSLQKRI